jgi:hypothetical protein
VRLRARTKIQLRSSAPRRAAPVRSAHASAHDVGLPAPWPPGGGARPSAGRYPCRWAPPLQLCRLRAPPTRAPPRRSSPHRHPRSQWNDQGRRSPQHLAAQRSGLRHLNPTPPRRAATPTDGDADAIGIPRTGTGYVAHSNLDVSLPAPHRATGELGGRQLGDLTAAVSVPADTTEVVTFAPASPTPRRWGPPTPIASSRSCAICC